MFSASAPGKLILLGEHAVVYGHRAIAATVGLRTTVELEPVEGPTRVLSSQIQDERLESAIRGLMPTGWGLRIRSELPIGRGMGSSASLAIALLRARARAEGREASLEELIREGFALERVFHGNPSGLDHTVIAMGGAVVYRKGEAPLALDLPTLRVVVVDSGSAGNTAELVAGVAARRPGVDPLLERLGALVEQTLPHVGEVEALGAAMDEAQALLAQIGVSTPILDEICALARAHGARGAKLAGAGGGGVVVALTPDGGDALVRAAQARGLRAFPAELPSA